MLEQTRPETKKAVNDITAVFSCEDGGISFVKLMTFIDFIDRKAVEGDDLAQRAIRHIVDFHRLIMGAQKAVKLTDCGTKSLDKGK